MNRYLVGLLLCACAGRVAATDVNVFAAASLVDALTEVSSAYRSVSVDSPRFSFAASSLLARQIEQQAPASVFISADEQSMDYLAERGLLAKGTRADLLANRLVLIGPADRPRKIEIRSGFDLAGLLDGGRLAIGDPALVPAGRYAREALTKLGVWGQASTCLLAADSVRAALLYVERGEAPLGIVYATDASASRGVTVLGEFPAYSHRPIVYPIAIVGAGDTPAARAFVEYLRGPVARAIFERYGFYFP